MEHSARRKMINLRHSFQRGHAASGSLPGGWRNLIFDLIADSFRRSRRLRVDFNSLTPKDLCPHDSVTEIRRVPRRIVRCRRCGVAFAADRDNLDRAIDRHQGDYFLANKDFTFEDGDVDIFSYLMPRILFFWALGYPRYRPARRRALDVGAGQGIMVKYLDFLGWDAWGVEISQWAVEQARARFGCDHMIQGTVQSAGLDTGSFDLVTLIHVLEHVDEPVPLLSEIYRILADGAYLYVEVPSSERDTSDYYIDDHFWFYSVDSLRYLLSSIGFREVNVSEGTFNPRLHNVPFIFAAAKKPE